VSARKIRRSHERTVARRVRRAGVATGAAVAAALAAAPAADAANFQVTTTGDAGAGSLRQAIADANLAANSPANVPDTITFAPAVSGEIRLTTGQIQITDDVTITGPGQNVLAVSGDANDNDVHDGPDSRIFQIVPPGTTPPLRKVSISGLTFRQGTANPSPYGNPGGAILAQGTALTLNQVTFADNQASGQGGAVANLSGALAMTNSTVTDNRAFDFGGGVVSNSYNEDDSADISNTTFSGNRVGDPAPTSPYSYPGAGALAVSGRSQLTDLTVTDNHATETFGTNPPTGRAGGVSLNGDNGEIVMTGSKITGNSAASYAGGLDIQGDVTVSNTTVADNGARYAGGVYSEGGAIAGSTIADNAARTGGGLWAGGGGDTIVRNSTISGNEASGGGTMAPYTGVGGGVLAYTERKYGPNPSDVKIRATTIADNTAAVSGGGLYAYQKDPVDEPFVQLRGTILANGTAPGNGDDVAQNQSGSIQAGFSLIESTGGIAIFGDPGGTNLTGLDPKLGPLASNGGPTQTRALDPTSPAVDASQAFGLSTDQRGSPRTVDSAASNAALSDGTDIGAYELQDENATGDDDVTKPKVEVKAPKKLKLKPGKKTAKAKVKFSAEDDRTGAKQLKFECKLDKGKFSRCSSPLKLKLDKGKHKVQVRATDAAGNTGKAKAKIKVVEKGGKKK
jgi:hypothetical protein